MIWIFGIRCRNFAEPLAMSPMASNSLTMTSSFTTHSELLKELKTAVNRVAYSSTKSNHKAAIKAMHAMFEFLEQVELVEDQPKPKASKASKKPRKVRKARTRRPNKNEVLEAKMQRESLAKQEAKQAKLADASRKVVDAVTEGEPEVGRARKEVFVAPKEHKADRKDAAKRSAMQGLQGLSPEDAARRDRLIAEREALEQALLADFEAFDDCPF
jgi:hypothetical protein